ncbi:nuclease [Methylobacterium sp. E-005]|uniref:thermonuclease family protein n=1 Tax=Methylobacterium sp. E-005 TaxID=2836549 RepID=UPI001FBBC669|nr:nuclease [Methylobacterium sp. E-005]MCJ2087349.1 nuclease [Methylobacterium sp. E-005]
MTSSTSVEQEAEPARPALDDPGRRALRVAIRDAIARARPRPVAVQTLELLAEAACTPDEAGTGLRVLDRQGNPRHRDGSDAPMSLADLVAELRVRHPALFLPPEPEIESAAPLADEARDSALLTGAYEMTAATARFVGAQSERARSLAERSSEQGRVLAQNAAGRFATLQTRLRGRFTRPVAVEDAATSGAAPAVDPALAWNRGPGRFGETIRDGLGRLRTRLGTGSVVDDGTHRQRRLLLGAAAGTLAAVIAAGLVLESRGPETQRPAASATPRKEAPGGAVPNNASPNTAASAPSAAPDTVTPPPETAGDGEPDTPLPPNAVAGPTQVIDTATLKVGGKVVHLFGVEWVRGGQAEELARYIGSRPVTCQPAPGSTTMNCLVDGRDLSEVVLFNGGGRASPEASPELVAAEDHARSERLGVWKR